MMAEMEFPEVSFKTGDLLELIALPLQDEVSVVAKALEAHLKELQEREGEVKTAEELVKMALKKMAAGR